MVTLEQWSTVIPCMCLGSTTARHTPRNTPFTRSICISTLIERESLPRPPWISGLMASKENPRTRWTWAREFSTSGLRPSIWQWSKGFMHTGPERISWLWKSLLRMMREEISRWVLFQTWDMLQGTFISSWQNPREVKHSPPLAWYVYL